MQDLPTKRDLFYWWATDHFGEAEGKKLYQALLLAERVERAIRKQGDFVTARQSLLQIAMALPEAAQASTVPTLEPDPARSERWRELMALRYRE